MSASGHWKPGGWTQPYAGERSLARKAKARCEGLDKLVCQSQHHVVHHGSKRGPLQRQKCQKSDAQRPLSVNRDRRRMALRSLGQRPSPPGKNHPLRCCEGYFAKNILSCVARDVTSCITVTQGGLFFLLREQGKVISRTPPHAPKDSAPPPGQGGSYCSPLGSGCQPPGNSVLKPPLPPAFNNVFLDHPGGSLESLPHCTGPHRKAVSSTVRQSIVPCQADIPALPRSFP